MIIALGQINTKIADFNGNCEKIIFQSRKALKQHAEIIVFPELCVCGYPPLDLLTYPSFVEQNRKSIQYLCEHLPGEIAVVVGYVDANTRPMGKALENLAVVIYQGQVIHRQAKSLLPTYDVFDESRYFEPASQRKTFSLGGRRIGVAICEDIWVNSGGELTREYPVNPARELAEDHAELLLVLSASPFHTGKMQQRISLMEEIGKSFRIPSVYVNAVGANDSLIFDGRSMAIDARGRILHVCEPFQEELYLCSIDEAFPDSAVLPEESVYKDLKDALVLGIRDYLAKSGFQRVHLGISGGIDSALTAAIAVEAVGPDRVHGYAMPSRYSSSHSLEDARKLSEHLGFTCEEISIEPMFTAALESLSESFRGLEEDVTEENIQARIRGLLLMAWSNKKHSLLLTTGNKSEIAVGYCTLYGDMNGSLEVIGDLFKTEVFGLSRYINSEAGIPLIPERIITKPPSAELRPGQLDQDSLPSYNILDEILRMHLHDCRSLQDIEQAGYDRDVIRQVIRLVERSEYKRRQAAMVLKVSPKAFGAGRRIPMARSLYELEG